MLNYDPSISGGEVLGALTALAHLDADAFFAYGHAVAHTQVPQIRAQLIEIREEYHRHVQNLREAIRKLGGEPPAFTRDLKGLLLESMAALRCITGTRGALLALSSIEDISSRAYAESLALGLPAPVQELCERHFAHEVAHRAYLHQALQSLSRETAGARAEARPS